MTSMAEFVLGAMNILYSLCMLLLLMSDRKKPQFINIISIINIVNSVHCVYISLCPFFFLHRRYTSESDESDSSRSRSRSPVRRKHGHKHKHSRSSSDSRRKEHRSISRSSHSDSSGRHFQSAIVGAEDKQ